LYLNGGAKGDELARMQYALSLPLFVVGISVSTASVAVEPNQEVIPLTEAFDTRTVVKTIEGAINGAYAIGVRPALRDAHAKGHGCVNQLYANNTPAAAQDFEAPCGYEARPLIGL